MQDSMELSWSDKCLSLPVFLKRYALPQIVKIAEGTYGDDDETTLSSDQVLNLHLLKDMEFYSGLTDSGQEIHIPRNSPHRVSVFLNIKGVQYKSLHELCELFPKKYKYIRLANSRKNPCDPRRIIDAEEKLKTLYFDKDRKSLVCIDIEGCEILIGLDMLHEVRPIEQIDGLFIAEVYQRYSLPLTVQFIQRGTSNSATLERGKIHLNRVIVKQTVVASTRDSSEKSILTFPSSLDVDVLIPQGAAAGNKLGLTADSKLYRDLCKQLNNEINLRKVEETIENEIYDDVKDLPIKIIPYAEIHFGGNKNEDIKPVKKEKKINLTEGMDGYISFDDSSDDSTGDGIYEVMDKLPRAYAPPLAPKPSTRQHRIQSSNETSPISSTSRQSGFFRKKLSTLLVKKKDSSSVSPKTSPKSSVSSPDALQSPSFQPYRPEEDDYDDDGEEYAYPCLPAVPPPGPGRPGTERHYHEPIQTVIKANRKIEDLTIQEVGMLLHDLNLGKYGEIFEKEQIDGNMLKDLDKEILVSHFNMTSFHALKLIKASKENWRPTTKE